MNPTEIAARTYIAAFEERDLAKRAQMLEACWAEDGRFVTRTREVVGRAALAKEMDRFLADPRGGKIKMLSAIDAVGNTFRFRGDLVLPDGTSLGEAYDTGIVGPDGRITLLLTFGGPLPGVSPDER